MYSKSFFAALFCLSTFSLMADSIQPTNSQSKNSPAFTSQPNHLITPSLAPVVSHGADVFISADFIWWKSTHNDPDFYNYIDVFALSEIPTNDVPIDTSAKSTHKSTEYGFEPGFKVGLGLNFAHDGWDLFAQYTWLDPVSQYTSVHAKVGMVPYASSLYIASGEPDNMYLEHASSHYTQHFNVLDVTLGRNFFISRRLSLHPTFGFKFAWLKSQVNNTYIPLTFEIYEFNTNDIKKRFTDKIFGVGMRAGIDSVWHFWKTWGLYGNAALTGLWYSEHYQNKQLSDVGGEGLTLTYNQQGSSQGVRAVIELGMGLTYMKWFYDEKYMLQISTGWESQFWVDILDNLTLQGLTVKAAFAF